jgi:hypothetical protein
MKTFTTFAVLFTLFSIIVFTNCKAPAPVNTDPKLSKILEVASIWEYLSEAYEPIYDTDATWLNSGLRAKYAMAKKYASLKILESTFGAKVFLKGPHTGGLNFNSTTSFGYYNPDFINKVKAGFKEALTDPNYKRAMSTVYRNYLQGMANTYMDAYRYLNNDPKMLAALKSKYTADMARPGGTLDGSFQETFRSYAEDLEREKGADIFEGFTAPAFWLRRSMDGTAASWFDLLKMVDNELK